MKKRDLVGAGYSRVFLGAGPASLYAAYKLPGRSLILEKNAYVGGLASRQKFSSGYFDIGPHVFSTADKKVNRDLKEIVGDRLYRIRLNDKILSNGRVVNLPHSFCEFIYLPGLLALKIAAEILISRFRGYSNVANSDDFFRKRFSSSYYELFLKDLFEKNTGDLSEVSPDWAKRRFSLPTRKPFYCKFGYGFIFEELGRKALEKGSKIMFSSKALKLNISKEKIVSIEIEGPNGIKEELRVSGEVYSSIPIDVLVSSIPGIEGEYLNLANECKYIHFIICIITLKDREQRPGYCPLWIKDRNFLISRCFDSMQLSSQLSTDAYIEAEIPCPPTRMGVWKMSDHKITKKVREEILALGIAEESNIKSMAIFRFNRAYPYYDLSYKPRIKKIRKRLGQIRNLHTIGRNGTFSYFNTLEAMKSYETA